MAARENQGLHIALIIFVILTIMMSASTYVLFKNSRELDDKLKVASADKAQIETKRADTAKDVDSLLQLIGYAPGEGVVKTALSEQNDEINTKYAAALGLASVPDDSKNLRKVLGQLADAIKSKEDTAEARDKVVKQLTAQLADAQGKSEAKLVEVVKARDAAIADLENERKAYKDAVVALTTEKEQLVKEKTDKNKAIDEQKAVYEKRIAEITVQLAAARKDVGRLQEEIKKYYVIDASAAGGQITWVSQRDNMAYINLGTDDGLHRRITFSVYPPGTNDVSKAAPKGKIEVINVTGPKLAEARIVESTDKDPLLPGDLIHTQGWHPGQHEHFGIAGYVDIDGTTNEQTRKLHDLVVANGGIVDAEILETKDKTGTSLAIRGSLNVNTRYLIMGEIGADKPNDKGRLEKSTTLINEAKRLGVEQIGLQKFLGMMGYTPRSGAGGVTNNGPAAANAGAKAGETDTFRPRQPPARGVDNGAF